MGWLLTKIFFALLLCFVVGLLLGLVWWWLGRKKVEAMEAELATSQADLKKCRADLEACRAKSKKTPTPTPKPVEPVAAAPVAAVTSWSTGTTKLGTAAAGHEDDLKVVSGIGPVMEKTLKEFDIQSWEQLAAFTAEDVAKVTEAISAFPGRIERDKWVEQAKELVEKFPLNDPYDRPTRETFLNKKKK